MVKKKKKGKKQGKTKGQKYRGKGTSEWVGGRMNTAFYITEDRPYRPDMIIWLELPSEIIVGSELLDPNEPPVSFGDTLLDAMKTPMAGPPRRPARIRVADDRLAAEVRKAAPGIQVVVAPTPELNEILRLMTESLPADGDGGPSYFEGGRISADALDALFHAARLLYRVSPWKKAHDGQLLRLDIPALDVDGACVSIIGALEESLGFIIFPSLLAFEKFLTSAEADSTAEGPVDLGTTTLSLTFERGADLPVVMRREAAEYGWPVAGPSAYPWVQHRDRDGVPRPLAERDVRVASACATSLTSLFIKHGHRFEEEPFEPFCESYYDEDDLEVRFTVPYEAGSLFAINDPPQRSSPESKKSKVGRNAPCPCGSGKKYKKCCLGKEEAARAAEPTPAALHEMDRRIVKEIMEFAILRFGDAWLRVMEDFDDAEAAAQLFNHWSVYHFVVKGKPVVAWYVEEQGSRLSNSEFEWLNAQSASWLSLWEVTGVTPGSSLTIRDLLTGETRVVQESSGSEMLVMRDVILGRIVDSHGMSLLCGIHPRPLPPVQAAEVERRIRGRVRRKRAVPVDRLRDEKVGRYMIARWDEAVLDLDLSRRVPPRLQNTDGEELLFTVDHFGFDSDARKDIEYCLIALEGVEPPGPDDPDQSYTFVRPGNTAGVGFENTVVGRAEVFDGRLRLETNSVKRADLLRERVEAACGGLIHHRAREHSDPVARLRNSEEGPGPLKPPSDEADRVLREFKERHYASWVDQPLPALAGETPREALRTKEGRARVDLLLKECENHEARMPDAQRFDFSIIRRELGLDG